MAKNLTLVEYIEFMGAVKVAEQTDVDPASVYYWKQLKTAPSPHNAWKLIKDSNGILTWAGIYQPFVDNLEQKQLEFDLKDEA